jgi:hypothetical protein
MKFLIHLVAEFEAGQHVQEIACLERKEHRLEDIGLTLREAKNLLGAIQQRMVEQQVEELSVVARIVAEPEDVKAVIR